MKKITFSIIVVCLNAGQELLRTVDSILGQTYPHFEIIVKDGMSSDGFVEKLPGDERIRVVRQKDKGSLSRGSLHWWTTVLPRRQRKTKCQALDTYLPLSY